MYYTGIVQDAQQYLRFCNSHTNGLASGNVIEEAICHALCEVIERDAVSLADLCASSIPYNIVHNIIDSFKGENSGHSFSRIPIEDLFVDDLAFSLTSMSLVLVILCPVMAWSKDLFTRAFLC